MLDKGETPMAGVHRKKRQVDRLWLNRQLAERKWTVEAFGVALAREMKRGKPIDKASMTRRMQGKIPFPAVECEALARMFGVPLEEIVQRVGSSLVSAAPLVGTVDGDGRVTFTLDVSPRDRLYRLKLATQDGWGDATLTVVAASIPPATAPRGIYVVHNGAKVCIRQYLGAHGKQGLLATVFDSTAPVETVNFSAIRMLQRVLKITL